MEKKNILVFPCGSEIGLEIHRSLRYSRFVNLIGASSVSDHGKFVFDHYVGGLPFVEHPDFIRTLNKIVTKFKIDAIYPTMDSVITKIANEANIISCKILTSSYETVKICNNKRRAYEVLGDVVQSPVIFDKIDDIPAYPVFIKPNTSYGSRGAKKINNKKQAESCLRKEPDSIILEYLPGKEYTVDCFTDKNGSLLFVGGRFRNRILKGISVNTTLAIHNSKMFKDIAKKISSKLNFRGAWFFQVKEDSKQRLSLLEVACRLGGASALYRAVGVNFALMTIFDAFEERVEICMNKFSLELDRALYNCYHLDVDFNKIYIDLDDCLINDNKVNTNLVKLIYQFINQNKQVILLTKHSNDIDGTLNKFRLSNLFDKVILLNQDDCKYKYIEREKSIFIDDSFRERCDVYNYLKIPVFSPDSIECLVDYKG